MRDPITITLHCEPLGQPRARFRRWQAADGRSGVSTYDPAKARTWKGEAKACYLDQLRELGIGPPLFPEGALVLDVLAVFTCPTSHFRKREPLPRRWHTKKPDGDNVVKAIKDSAKGVLWLDDAQVAVTTITKVIGAQGEAPFVRLTVYALAPDTATLEAAS